MNTHVQSIVNQHGFQKKKFAEIMDEDGEEVQDVMEIMMHRKQLQQWMVDFPKERIAYEFVRVFRSLWAIHQKRISTFYIKPECLHLSSEDNSLYLKHRPNCTKHVWDDETCPFIHPSTYSENGSLNLWNQLRSLLRVCVCISAPEEWSLAFPKPHAPPEAVGYGHGKDPLFSLKKYSVWKPAFRLCDQLEYKWGTYNITRSIPLKNIEHLFSTTVHTLHSTIPEKRVRKVIDFLMQKIMPYLCPESNPKQFNILIKSSNISKEEYEESVKWACNFLVHCLDGNIRFYELLKRPVFQQIFSDDILASKNESSIIEYGKNVIGKVLRDAKLVLNLSNLQNQSQILEAVRIASMTRMSSLRELFKLSSSAAHTNARFATLILIRGHELLESPEGTIEKELEANGLESYIPIVNGPHVEQNLRKEQEKYAEKQKEKGSNKKMKKRCVFCKTKIRRIDLEAAPTRFICPGCSCCFCPYHLQDHRIKCSESNRKEKEPHKQIIQNQEGFKTRKFKDKLN